MEDYNFDGEGEKEGDYCEGAEEFTEDADRNGCSFVVKGAEVLGREEG